MKRICGVLAVFVITTMAVPNALGLEFADDALFPPKDTKPNTKPNTG